VDHRTGELLWRAPSYLSQSVGIAATEGHVVVGSRFFGEFGLYRRDSGQPIIEVHDSVLKRGPAPVIGHGQMFLQYRDTVHAFALDELPLEPLPFEVRPHAFDCS
jgi:hypothetical protein